jgi:hypothetical protein
MTWRQGQDKRPKIDKIVLLHARGTMKQIAISIVAIADTIDVRSWQILLQKSPRTAVEECRLWHLEAASRP